MTNTTTTNATPKTTHKEYYAMLTEVVNASGSPKTDELIKFIESRVELLDKKKASKANSEKVAETEANKDVIYNALLVNGDVMTVTEIQCVCPAFSNQKATSLLTKLVADGKVERSIVKSKSYYKAVMGE